jgi:hypothetical protein
MISVTHDAVDALGRRSRWLRMTQSARFCLVSLGTKFLVERGAILEHAPHNPPEAVVSPGVRQPLATDDNQPVAAMMPRLQQDIQAFDVLWALDTLGLDSGADRENKCRRVQAEDSHSSHLPSHATPILRHARPCADCHHEP